MNIKFTLLAIIPSVIFCLPEDIHAAPQHSFATKSECAVRYADLKTQCKDVQSKLAKAQNEIARLERENEALRAKAQALHDPTWEQVKALVLEDEGGSRTYKDQKYNCENFALALRDAAQDRGFDAGYVSLSYEDESIGHALNAFDTLDHGLIYVEPQKDQIAYVKVGKPFGTIPIEAVKHRFLLCPKNPNDLVDSIGSSTYLGRLFDHAFYENHQKRQACADAALTAYNNAVDDYNRGISQYTSRQIKSWLTNLNLLMDDLGRRRLTQGNPIVKHIKTHWR